MELKCDKEKETTPNRRNTIVETPAAASSQGGMNPRPFPGDVLNAIIPCLIR